jgi:nucleotide-binding universal stress UspA family protein
LKKKKIDLVAVSAKIGPMAALIGGSITRQIVRGSQVPVLVLK